MTPPRGKLDLDPVTVRKARTLARQAGRPIVTMAKKHTTVSVERATLRLAGLQGADADGIPWVNRLLDAVRATSGSSTASPRRCGTRWSGRGRRPVHAGAEGVRGVGALPAARGRDLTGRSRRHGSRSAPGSGASTRGAGSASGW